MNTGISKPFRRYCEQGFVFRGHALCFSRPQAPSSVDLPVVHEFQNFWVELLAVRGNFEAKNIMTWHMNWGYGTSCASGPQKVVGDVYKRGTRMACHIPSTARRNIDPLMCQNERRE
jgi:hypothetical protein